MKAKGKKPRLIRWLALAVLVTSLAVSGTMARYSSRFGAQVSMQVAAFAGGGEVNFDVALEGMAPGDTRTVQFKVRNYEGEQGCDAQMAYEIQVETTGNLPLTFSLLGEDPGDSSANSALVGALDSSLKAVGGKLPVTSLEGKREHSYQLSVYWPSGETDVDYSHEIDMVSVTVAAIQTDPSA